jgi:hypothetical protein
VAGPSFTAFSVTIDDIRQWMQDRARLDEEIAEKQVARDKISARLDAVASLVDKETHDALFDIAAGASTARTDENSFSGLMKRTVEAAHEGITTKELRESVTDPAFLAKMNRSPNIFYSAINRLERREEIVRRGKLLISPANLRLIIAKYGEDWQGFAEDEFGPAEIVLQFAEKCGGAALPLQFIAEMKRHPGLAEKINRNPQYGYNILSRLVRQEKLVRDGKRYALPRKENESPQGASDEGSLDGLNPPRELFPKPRAVGT